jgi:hypothetical protein
MEDDKDAESAISRTGQEPDPPERVGAIERPGHERLDERRDRRLVSGRGKRGFADVSVDAEGPIVDPERPTGEQARAIGDAPQVPDHSDPGVEFGADVGQTETAIAVEQRGTVEGGEDAKVEGPIR